MPSNVTSINAFKYKLDGKTHTYAIKLDDAGLQRWIATRSQEAKKNGFSFDDSTINLDGVSYHKKKVKQNGKDMILYVRMDGSTDEIFREASEEDSPKTLPADAKETKKPKKADEKPKGFWAACAAINDTVVKGCNAAADFLEKGMDTLLGIDSSAPIAKKDDDGELSWADKGKYALRGIGKMFTGMLRNPKTTVVVGGLAIAAAALIPGAGPAMLVAGLVMGVGTTVVGGIQAGTAKTDAQARAGWEKIGSGTFTALTSALGLRKMGAAKRAAQIKASAAKLAKNRQDLELVQKCRDVVMSKNRPEIEAFGKANQEFVIQFKGMKASEVISKLNNKIDVLNSQISDASKYSTGIKGWWDRSAVGNLGKDFGAGFKEGFTSVKSIKNPFKGAMNVHSGANMANVKKSSADFYKSLQAGKYSDASMQLSHMKGIQASGHLTVDEATEAAGMIKDATIALRGATFPGVKNTAFITGQAISWGNTSPIDEANVAKEYIVFTD